MIIRNCDMNKFFEEIREKNIICFAVGLQMHSMVNMYFEDCLWNEKIRFIVDNDNRLWGEKYFVRGNMYNICSPNILKKECRKDDVIVICSLRCNEILNQLEEIKELENIKCYIFPLMQTYTQVEDNMYLTSGEKEMIPRKIHYCWFGGKPLNKTAVECIESWKKYCPDYEIIRWDESNFNVNENRYVREAYKNKAYAFVSDYARLKILYENGGIYMDVDVEVLKNLDPLLKNQAYCGFSSHVPRINTGLGFGSIKGFELLKEMMDVYKYEVYETDAGFNKTLCQLYNTKVLVYHGLVQNGRYQVVKGMACYPKDYFDPMSSCYYIAPNINNAYSVHKSANTWSNMDSIFKNDKKLIRNSISNVFDKIKV